MFSPKITSTDSFLDMPVSARELYFQLGMNADDDGFITPRKIMRMTGATADDLNVLIGKKFVIPFDSGVIVIAAWRVNNMVRKDWYKPTIYQEELAQLVENPSGKYEFVNEMLTDCSRRLGKVRLGKGRLGEGTDRPKLAESKPSVMVEEDFNQFWSSYPNKKNKVKAKVKFLTLKKELLPTILGSVEAQKKTRQWQDPRYIPHAVTWINNERWNDEETEVVLTKEQETIEMIRSCGGDQELAMNRMITKYGDGEKAEILKYKHLYGL